MTAKTTYWLVGPEGNYVQVEGADQRDAAAGAGWAEDDGPAPYDRVWMRHGVTGAYATFAAAGLDGWRDIGWESVVPPTRPADYGHEVVLPGPGQEPGPVSEPAPEVSPPQVDQPKAEIVKEKKQNA